MWSTSPAKRPRQAGIAGFTLLEVMVAIAIVAIALVPLLQLHLVSLDGTIRSQDLTTAVMLAQERMGRLPEFPEPGEEQGTFEGRELAKYRWLTVVKEQEVVLGVSAQLIQLRHIAVTVTWTDRLQEHSYTLQTYAAQ